MSKMIHKKYFDLLKHFLEDYAKELYGRELLKKTPVSQKAIALALAELEVKGILKSRKQGNIKYFRFNLEHSEIKDILLSLETARKLEFFKKERKMAHLFKEDHRIVGIFGSYVKGTAREDSDIDVFVIGGKMKQDYDAQGRNFDLHISLKYFSEREFIALIKQKNPLCKEIIKHHVLVFGIERFISLLWKWYYDFN